tara:strand:+ start:568 stop:1284 length:717 start_codon:yes stop_codon:yes gene_type:complete
MKNLKKGFRKYLKGIFAIFIINLFLFGSTSLFQSCSNNDNLLESEEKIALSKFENLIRTTTPKIQNIVNKKQRLFSAKNANANEINTKAEEEAQEVLKPIVSGTKELLATFGFTESDLAEGFDNLEDPRIALVGFMILSASNEGQNKTISQANFFSLFTNSLYAQGTYDNVRSCFLETTGIAAGVALVSALTAATIDKGLVKKLIKKAVKKIGSRALGGIGLLIIAVDFSNCMYKKHS